MANLDNVRNALALNAAIPDDVKDNIFELVVVFNNKFPKVDLNSLEKRLQTLKIEKISKFLNRDISMYDFRKNVIYFNAREMERDYDVRHVLMFELLKMISSNGFQTGFNNNDKFEALNDGYTEILTNFLVGNRGELLIFPNEAIMANMIGVIVGQETLYESYFNNDVKILLDALVRAGVEL